LAIWASVINDPSKDHDSHTDPDRAAKELYQAAGEGYYRITMSALKENIIEKLDTLPDSTLKEVLDFVTFLAWKGTEIENSLLTVAGKLSGDPISAKEIEAALYGPPAQ
jgi:hypothetical protein